MDRLKILGVVTLAGVLIACASTDPDRPTAADATVGVWGGSITVDDERQDISYAVRLQKGRSTANVILPPRGDEGEQQIPMKNLAWDGTHLDYAWTTPDGTALTRRAGFI